MSHQAFVLLSIGIVAAALLINSIVTKALAFSEKLFERDAELCVRCRAELHAMLHGEPEAPALGAPSSSTTTEKT